MDSMSTRDLRDYGRKQVYRAEHSVFADYFKSTPVDHLRSEAARLAKLCGMVRPPEVKPVRARGGSAAGGKVMLPADGSMCRVGLSYLLHEMAHLLTPPAQLQGQTHGPAFRRTMVRLVGIAYGEIAARMLTASYAAYGVPVDAEKDVMMRRKETRPRLPRRKYEVRVRDFGYDFIDKPSRLATKEDLARLDSHDRKKLVCRVSVVVGNLVFSRKEIHPKQFALTSSTC